MMLFRGLGQPNTDPTAAYTDPTGVACRAYETTEDTYGNYYCDPCKMGEDSSGNPVSCPDGTTMIPSTAAPTATASTLPVSIPTVSSVTPVSSTNSMTPVIAPVAPNTVGYSSQMIGYDANGNPIYANCNASGQCFDANGNPIQPTLDISTPTGPAAWLQSTFGPNWAMYAVGALAMAAVAFGAVVIFRR